MKMFFKIVLGVSLVFFASLGCIFKEGGSSYTPPKIINDNIRSIYVSESNDTIVYVGDDYHYVFQNNQKMKQEQSFLIYLLVNTKDEPISFKLSKNSGSNFSTNKDQDQDLYVRMDISIDKSRASQSLLDWATNANYVEYGKMPLFRDIKGSSELEANIGLAGEIYKANKEINIQLSSYITNIEIEIVDSKNEKIDKVSPLKIDNDGVLSIKNQKLLLILDLENRLK
jgi:hypothetical protein